MQTCSGGGVRAGRVGASSGTTFAWRDGGDFTPTPHVFDRMNSGVRRDCGIDCDTSKEIITFHCILMIK